MQNPLSLRAFLAWVEKQPADKKYDYCDHKRCPCAQYAAAVGIEYTVTWPDPKGTFWARAEQAAASDPETFGALAVRLRASA